MTQGASFLPRERSFAGWSGYRSLPDEIRKRSGHGPLFNGQQFLCGKNCTEEVLLSSTKLTE
jgi:hypothetical protein